MTHIAIQIGSLVRHISHDLGIGLVKEIREDIPTGAYKCIWSKAPFMTLFICGDSLKVLS
tara:strand:- start:792 stop:971 length:180 start_codon:yes stop_codon:yes gene_type:complete